ncbi:acyl-CoA dehydrogenase family protein [Rhodococcoides yunnanense]|uniref:acyl-CoA dehydrogenase family protein n=1 Tax=Rhodococcoides yunnanense TaxID=278209 RepID=UPI000932E081|nr:acyl-CoA dehydrogenase family protein [Rhodococcus yunnanensis]
MSTLPTEFGSTGADGIRDLVQRATSRAPIAAYAEEGIPPVSWSAIADAGWDEAGIVEDGDGATTRDLVEIAREWGYGCIPQPLLPTLLAKRLSRVARSAAGPVTFALSMGEKSLVPFGQIEAISVVTELGTDGGELHPVSEGEPDGLDLIARGLRSTASQTTTLTTLAAREVALVFAAEALGGAERLLSDSIEFAKQRTQFGRPVGSFQAVKHKIADAAIAVEAAETALIWGSQRQENAFRASVFATDRCVDAAEIAVQVHGGLGFTWEAGLHFPFRKLLSAHRVAASLEHDHG